MPIEAMRDALQTPDHRVAALQAAGQSITLVKDTQSLLPLAPATHRRVVIVAEEGFSFWDGALSRGYGPVLDELRTETVMLPRDAYLGHTEMVPWRKAAGRISAEMICPYPPGIPIVAPGELLTDAIVDYLERQAAAGVMVEGAADESLAQMRVVAG